MVEEVLLGCIAKTTGEETLASLDDRLVDLTFDSLRFIQLVVQIEHALAVEFSDDRLNYHSFERVKDLSNYLNGLVAAKPNIGPRSTPA